MICFPCRYRGKYLYFRTGFAVYIREYLYIQGGKQGFDRKIFSAHALHHYMKSRIIIQHYAILSGISMGKQAVFIKT